MLSKPVRRALAACRRALDQQLNTETARLMGRWQLPSGQVFRVVRIQHNGLALVGNGRQRWSIYTHVLTVLADAGQIRFIGRD